MPPPPSKLEICKEYEAEIAQLKRMFDLYFQGIERLPPLAEREELRKAMQSTRGKVGSWRTSDKFKFNAVYNKFTSYDRMWNRQLQQIEDGTHPREKARRRLAQREREAAKAAAAMDEARGQNKAAAAAAKAADKAASSGLSDAKVEKIYSVYMQAKKRTGEKSNLTVDGLKKQLSKQVPAIKKKHGCKDVDFKVVLKNGKAMLKAVPK